MSVCFRCHLIDRRSAPPGHVFIIVHQSAWGHTDTGFLASGRLYVYSTPLLRVSLSFGETGLCK